MIDYKEQMDLTLYLNIALLGEVTANMRAVLISKIGSRIDVRFIFYKEPSEEELDAMGCIGTEVLAHYDEDTEFESYDVIPFGVISMKDGETTAFKRKEEIEI